MEHAFETAQVVSPICPDANEYQRYHVWCKQPRPFAAFVQSWEQLPSELQDYAFRFIAYDEDKAAFSNLSLVSQSWSKQFRPRLFAILELSDIQDCQMLYRILRSRTSSWLASRVEMLKIHVTCFLSSSLWMSILHLLPQCRTVDASHYVAEVVHARLSHNAALKSALRGVITLKLFRCNFPSLRILLRVLSDIPFMETIELREVTWSGDLLTREAATDLCTGGFLHVQWIHMWSCTNDLAVPAWILAAASTRHYFTRRTPEPAVPLETWAIVNLIRYFCDDEAVKGTSFSVHKNTPDSYVFGGALWTPYKGSDSSRTMGGIITVRVSRFAPPDQVDAPDAWLVEEIDLSDSENIGDNPSDDFGSSYLDSRSWNMLPPMLDAFRQLARLRVIGEDCRPDWSFRAV